MIDKDTLVKEQITGQLAIKTRCAKCNQNRVPGQELCEFHYAPLAREKKQTYQLDKFKKNLVFCV